MRTGIIEKGFGYILNDELRNAMATTLSNDWIEGMLEHAENKMVQEIDRQFEAEHLNNH